jgi:hypothetical protein
VGNPVPTSNEQKKPKEKDMKRKAVVTETVTYHIEFEVPDGADDDLIEELAHTEWGTNPDRDPDDYDCFVEVKGE